ncbi:MAG: DUF6265 family protein [Ignavibacteriaceae bacterium]
MKTLISVFFILLNLAVFPQNNLNPLFYLEGKWVIEGKNRTIHEEWTKLSDTVLTAVSFYVKDGDTTITETIKLAKIGDDIFYIPLVEHNPGPVKFKLTGITDKKAVFENPGHDFPSKIIYEYINEDSLNARIEGIENGDVKGFDYPFKRIK